MEGEDRRAQDKRVERLWQTLDTQKEGKLSLQGLRRGLHKLDHPLKNADSLLRDVIKAVDTNGDGDIQYSEFRTFIEQTETELWQLFKSIDHDRNGKIDKKELRSAFLAAGLVIPTPKLDQFFSEVDTNKDGTISFEEWRDFLLFLPATKPNLRAVLSYYSSTVTLNAEGDVQVTNDTVEGLGRHLFPKSLFGVTASVGQSPQAELFPRNSELPSNGSSRTICPLSDIKPQPRTGGSEAEPPHRAERHESTVSLDKGVMSKTEGLLTDMLPQPGYFLAGGIAGVVSRTATAPLDRLKVYLIAQTGAKSEAAKAIKEGAPVKALKKTSRPLIEATKSLWRMGGIRSLFAGNGLNVVKVMPESAIKFGSYESSKRIMARFEGHEDPKALKPWSQFFAAGFGGMFSQFCIYPLDTMKFRMQCETVEGGLRGNALISETARKVWRSSGLRGFYRGLPMGLIGMFPYSAIDLTTFEYLKQFITARNSRLRHCSKEEAAPGNIMTASIGACSGALGASVVYPINVLRTRLQSQGTAIHPPVYNGIWDVTLKTLKGEGVKGFYRGITPNLLKVVPAVSITYVVYDNSKAVMGLR